MKDEKIIDGEIKDVSLVETENKPLPSFPTESQINEYKRFLSNYNEFIESQLKDNVDYGKIPGVGKPSLFKPGAEKLEKLFFLTHEKQLVEKIVGDDFIKYAYRTIVYDKNGNVKATCEGTCNSKERKYVKTANPIEIENTIMKMAQKRSYVGAILEATNSSGRFTQDVEDINPNTGDINPNNEYANNNNDDKAWLNDDIFYKLAENFNPDKDVNYHMKLLREKYRVAKRYESAVERQLQALKKQI